MQEIIEREPIVKAQLKEAGVIGYDMVWFGDTWDLGPVNPVEPDAELVYDRDLVSKMVPSYN